MNTETHDFVYVKNHSTPKSAKSSKIIMTYRTSINRARGRS